LNTRRRTFPRDTLEQAPTPALRLRPLQVVRERLLRIFLTLILTLYVLSVRLSSDTAGSSDSSMSSRLVRYRWSGAEHRITQPAQSASHRFCTRWLLRAVASACFRPRCQEHLAALRQKFPQGALLTVQRLRAKSSNGYYNEVDNNRGRSVTHRPTVRTNNERYPSPVRTTPSEQRVFIR
jgi:hypothetical protein